MWSRVWRQSGRGRSRIAVVAPVVALLAATSAAMPQQDTSAAARKARARRAVIAGTRDSVLARARAESATSAPPGPTGTFQEPQAPMPPLIGLDTLSAKRLLVSKKMVRYVVQQPASDLIPVDTIAAQDPQPGEPYKYRSTEIRLTLVGRPRPPDSVTVPSVMGMTMEAAARALDSTKLRADSSDAPMQSADSIGRVVAQSPDSGTRVLPGSSVAISLGRDARIRMPRLIDSTSTVARRMLGEAGLLGVVSIRAEGREARADSVIVGQVPSPDDLVAASAPVTLVLASGQQASTVTVTTPVSPGPSVTPTPPPVPPVPGPRVPSVAERHVPTWLLIVALVVLTFATGAGAMHAARTAWPPPTVTPSASVHPRVPELMHHEGSLVDVSVSFRSHVEHEPSELHLTSAPPSRGQP